MSVITKINKWFQNIFKKEHKKKTWKPLSDEWFNWFSKHKDRNHCFFIVNIKASKNNLLSRIIGFFEGGYSHTVPVFFGDITKVLLPSGMDKLKKNLSDYYEKVPSLEFVKAWVIGSADDTGLNFCDFSTYQNRSKTIYRIKNVHGFDRLTFFNFAVNAMGTPYDSTGLFMKFLNIFKVKAGVLDDKNSFFCSEFTYDIFKSVGIKVSNNRNPGPLDIHKYLINNIEETDFNE